MRDGYEQSRDEKIGLGEDSHGRGTVVRRRTSAPNRYSAQGASCHSVARSLAAVEARSLEPCSEWSISKQIGTGCVRTRFCQHPQTERLCIPRMGAEPLGN